MSRREFSKQTQRDAAKRSGGHCEACTARLGYGQFHYDHILPDAMGGEPTLDNCQVLCIKCHKAKTSDRDIPMITKSNHQRDKALGIKSPPKFRKPAPGTRYEQSPYGLRPVRGDRP